MTLEGFLDQVQDMDAPDALWHLVLDFFFSRGAQMVSYRHWTSEPLESADLQMVSAGFPEDFIETFVREKRYLHNPISDLALHTSEPFYWSDTAALAGLSTADAAKVEELTEGLPGDGLIIQAFGPNRRAGTFNFGFEKDAARLPSTQVKEWQAATQIAHLTYCRMVPVVASDVAPVLTRRETEVLEWIARGKSNADIAGILGISAHTVDTHVRRIFGKLEVNDRTTAAVKGLGAGLLESAA